LPAVKSLIALLVSCLAPALCVRAADGAGSVAIDGPPAPVPPQVVSRDDSGRVTLRAVRVEPAPQLDGRLDDDVYARVLPASGFVQQEPHEGRPATEKTEVWLLFDSRHLYVAARCWDSRPERIVANEMRRDHYNIYLNDNFGVAIDTFYDRRNGFVFQTNPLGALRDGIVTDERNTNYDWSTVWETRTGRFEHGWTVEIAIPWKSLRYRRAAQQVWGINFRRIVRWKNEVSFLTPIPASFGGRGINKFSSAATVVGLETTARSLNLELKPYAISSLTSSLQGASPFENDFGRDAGLDAKYGLTKGLTADLTVNTDFAQVEEDDQQVNLTRFSLLFPEKRDFFLEGAGLFGFGGVAQRGQGPGAPPGGGGGPGSRPAAPSLTPMLFFSRRIGLLAGQAVPIRGGVRVTGRAGDYTLGALQIRTGDAPEVGARTTDFSVLRVRRDILRRSNVGMIFTRRAPALAGPAANAAGANSAYGADLNLALLQDLNASAFFAQTQTAGAPATARDRSSYRAQVEYAADRYGAVFEHLFVGPRFTPEAGFLRREAFRRSYAELRLSPRTRDSRVFRKWGLEASLDYITSPGGRLETREAQGTFRLDMQSGDQWALDYTRYLDSPARAFSPAPGVSILPRTYHYQDLKSTYQLGPQRRVIGALTLGRGSFYGGTRTEAGYQGRAELTSRLSIEPGVSFNWVRLPQGAFTTRLVTTRVSLSLTPRAFLSAFVQYNSTGAALLGSLRLRWEYRPGSDLYVVWSEGRDSSGRGFPTLANRTFVVKATRLFRF
jgi:hypothetical protein